MREIPPALAHYTNRSAIVSILEHGFLTLPCPRELMWRLLDIEPQEREPQEYGMVSFTGIRPVGMGRHRRRFGDYTLVVSSRWAWMNNAQRVIYLPPRGLRFRAFRKYFQRAHRLFEDKRAAAPYPDDGFWDMAFRSSHVAGIMGVSEWSEALRLYEVLQPNRDAGQREWRIVRPEPTSFPSPLSDRAALLETALGFAWWGLACVPVEPADVLCILAPKGDVEAVRSELPAAYAHVPVRVHGVASYTNAIARNVSDWMKWRLRE